MGDTTGISWADHTFNPWVGCAPVSAACDHCYAESWAKRAGQPELWQGARRRTSALNWKAPLRWDREAEAAGVRRRVFCASLADVFDAEVPRWWRADLWHLIASCPHLDWLLLTKRPENIARMLPAPYAGPPPWGEGWRNVWLGVTAETQDWAERRIPILLATPVAVRFVSAEPLLGPLDLLRWMHPARTLPGIDWVIAGGESGPDARPTHPDWARALRDSCAAAGVAFHWKQWGEWIEVDGPRCRAIRDPAPGDRWLLPDGTTRDRAGSPFPMSAYHHSVIRRVGKRAAGAMLDGREHLEFPR